MYQFSFSAFMLHVDWASELPALNVSIETVEAHRNHRHQGTLASPILA